MPGKVASDNQLWVFTPSQWTWLPSTKYIANRGTQPLLWSTWKQLPCWFTKSVDRLLKQYLCVPKWGCLEWQSNKCYLFIKFCDNFIAKSILLPWWDVSANARVLGYSLCSRGLFSSVKNLWNRSSLKGQWSADIATICIIYCILEFLDPMLYSAYSSGCGRCVVIIGISVDPETNHLYILPVREW